MLCKHTLCLLYLAFSSFAYSSLTINLHRYIILKY